MKICGSCFRFVENWRDAREKGLNERNEGFGEYSYKPRKGVVPRCKCMEVNEFKKLFNNVSDIVCNSKQSVDILKSFNEAISALYHIGGDERYISEVLNLSSYTIEKYKRLLQEEKIDLVKVADTLEMARSLLFGDCLNWRKIQSELGKIPEGVNSKESEG